MSKKYVVFLLILSMILSGCASYRDINNTMFATITIIDVDEAGKPVIYMECFLAYFSQRENIVMGNRTVLVGKGETISEAIQKINQTARHRISTVYSKMLMFTEKAAQKGLGDFLDILVRDQEYLLKPYIMILEGDPMELLNVELKQGDYVGLFLEQQLANDAISNLMRPYKLFDYVNMRTSEGHLAVVGIIGLELNEADPYLGIKEAAVLVEDKMVETLTEEEYKQYSLLYGTSKSTLMTVPNPEEEKSKVTLNVLKNKAKKSVEYDGKSGSAIHYKIEVNLRLSFDEAQKPIHLQEDQIRKALVDEIKQKVKDDGQALFDKYKRKNIDLFKVQEELYRKYPQYKDIDALGSTVLEVVVKTHLEGSPDVQNYYD